MAEMSIVLQRCGAVDPRDVAAYVGEAALTA